MTSPSKPIESKFRKYVSFAVKLRFVTRHEAVDAALQLFLCAKRNQQYSHTVHRLIAQPLDQSD